MNRNAISRAVRRALAAGSIATLALAALPVVAPWHGLAGNAWAAEDGDHSGTGGHTGGSGHAGGPPAGKGPGAGHGEEHGTDHGDDHGDDHGGGPGGKGQGGKGRGGPGSHSAGSGETGHVPGGTGRSGGGRPVWAQEGTPEVELGRLNVSRAPAHVLNRALDEAVNEFDPAMTAFYDQDAESAAAQLAADYPNVARIDSPVQNLALYQQLLDTGEAPLPGVTPSSRLDLAAIFLGSASDKAIPVSTDTITAVNAILGLPALSPADTQTLATKAEAVRSGIATGHGE